MKVWFSVSGWAVVDNFSVRDTSLLKTLKFCSYDWLVGQEETKSAILLETSQRILSRRNLFFLSHCLQQRL